MSPASLLAVQQGSLYASLQSLFAAHVHAPDAPAAVAAGASMNGSGSECGEVELTAEELPPGEPREVLSRTLALAAGALSVDDMKRILQEHYARFAVFETNLLWCPHSTALAAWLGAAGLLLQPHVEAIRCHRVVLRRVLAPAVPQQQQQQQHLGHTGRPGAPAVTEAGRGSAPSGPRAAGGSGRGTSVSEVQMQVQFDVAFTWRPLAPVHGLLASLPVKGLQLPAFTSDHTITLTVDSHSRVVSHQDIMHNVPLAPPLLKTVLGLPTPLLATLLHV